MDFKDSDSFNKALELHESELDGYSLSVDEAKPRDSQPSGGRGRGRFGDGGGRSGGRRGGRGRFGGRDGSGGRFGGRDSGGRGRGRGRGGFNKPSLVSEGIFLF